MNKEVSIKESFRVEKIMFARAKKLKQHCLEYKNSSNTLI